jgi:hypothetical protein
MNERIKLLAEQAFAVCGKHSNNYNGPAFSAKFAELIVRECMLQCDINQAGNTRLGKDFNEGHFMGVYESFHKIRNHFGVKEE